MSDLISVLIPCYNSERWIKKSLQSILNQTHSELQIVVIDDGSTDRSKEIITSFNDSRIEVYSQTRLGVAKALNSGLTKCKSAYICRMDIDDTVESSRIESQLKFMREYPEYGIVGSNYKIIDTNDKIKCSVILPEKDEQIKNDMSRRCSLWIGSAIIKKQLLLDFGGFNESRLTAEDWDFFLRVMDTAKFYNIQEFLSYKRIHENCISSSEIAKNESKEVLYFFNRKRIRNSPENKVIANSYFNIGYYHYYESEFEEAKSYFAKAVKRDRFNIQYLRYFFSVKLLKKVLPGIRKFKIYKILSPLKYLDKHNKFFKSQY